MAATDKAAYGIAFDMDASLTTAEQVPVNETPIDLFLLSDMPAAGSNQVIPVKKYIAIEAMTSLRYGRDGGNDIILDQLLDPTAPADNNTSRAVEGFEHTTTLSGVRVSSTTSRPWFMNIRQTSGPVSGSQNRLVHYTQITDLAGWTILNTAEAGAVSS